jgi:hypothetical protein
MLNLNMRGIRVPRPCGYEVGETALRDTNFLCEDAGVTALVELKNIISQIVSDSGGQSVGKRGERKPKRTRQGQLSICEPAILAITPPMITTPATTLSFFIIFLLKDSALSGGVSAGGEEGEGGDPSGVKDGPGVSPSGIEWCEGTDPPDIDSCEGTGASDDER